MYTGLYAAVSGSLAHEKRLAILTNNLANTNTVGFKADRPVFQVELLPHVVRPLVVSEASPAVLTPLDRFQGRESVQTRLSAMHTNFTQGDLRTTGNPLDVALEGRGFFAVQTADGVAYTRQGMFSLNTEAWWSRRTDCLFWVTKVPCDYRRGRLRLMPQVRCGRVARSSTVSEWSICHSLMPWKSKEIASFVRLSPSRLRRRRKPWYGRESSRRPMSNRSVSWSRL